MYLNNVQKESKRKFSGQPPDNPYIKMRFKLESLLGSSKENINLSDHGAALSPKPTQSKSLQEQLLKELEEFHEYYINRYATLKGEYDRLSQQTRDNNCADFKQLIEQKQLEIDRLAISVEQTECDKERMRLEYSVVLDKKNHEVAELRNICEQYQQKMQKNQYQYGSSSGASTPSSNNDPSLHRFYESLHESFRERSKYDQQKYHDQIRLLKCQLEELSREKQLLQVKMDQCLSENSVLQLKLREFEIERKYEAERIKNATFELQVQLKVKEEAVKKNEEELQLLRGKRNAQHPKEVCKEGSSSQSSLPVKEITSDINNYFTDEGVEAILSGREKPTLKLGDASFKGAFFEQRKSLTNQMCHLPVPEQMTQKKKERMIVHRRNLSSTLNNSPKDMAARESLNREVDSKLSSHDLKIKIFRLEKLKKK